MSSSKEISQEDQQVAILTEKFKNLGIPEKIESCEDLIALNEKCGDPKFAGQYVSCGGWGVFLNIF